MAHSTVTNQVLLVIGTMEHTHSQRGAGAPPGQHVENFGGLI